MTAALPPGVATVEFLGLHFARIDMAQAVAWVSSAARASKFRYVVTPNVDHLVRLHSNADAPWHAAFLAAEKAAALTLNDSRILARLAHWSGVALAPVPGSDLTRELLSAGTLSVDSVALIGGGAAEAAWLKQRLPLAQVVHMAPPMGVRDDPAAQAEIAAFIEAARPQLALFAIGAPQSEIVAHLVQRRAVAGGVGLCIGASIEFLTGGKRRAPRLFQRLGLEWAFRLLSEPRRLWRRYLVEGPQIFRIWVRWRGRRAI